MPNMLQSQVRKIKYLSSFVFKQILLMAKPCRGKKSSKLGHPTQIYYYTQSRGHLTIIEYKLHNLLASKYKQPKGHDSNCTFI